MKASSKRFIVTEKHFITLFSHWEVMKNEVTFLENYLDMFNNDDHNWNRSEKNAQQISIFRLVTQYYISSNCYPSRSGNAYF